MASLPGLLSFPLTCLLPALQIHWHTHTSGPLHVRCPTFAMWLAPFRSLLKHHFLTKAILNHLNLKFQLLPPALPIFFHSFILYSTSLSDIFHVYMYIRGFPRWHSGKESACQCWRCGFDSWVGKIPWSRKWQSTQ